MAVTSQALLKHALTTDAASEIAETIQDQLVPASAPTWSGGAPDQGRQRKILPTRVRVTNELDLNEAATGDGLDLALPNEIRRISAGIVIIGGGQGVKAEAIETLKRRDYDIRVYRNFSLGQGHGDLHVLVIDASLNDTVTALTKQLGTLSSHLQPVRK